MKAPGRPGTGTAPPEAASARVRFLRFPAAALLLMMLASASAARGNPAELAALSGIVRDPAGQLLEGSVLLLTPVSPSGEIRTAATSRDGRFLFADVPQGVYRVTAMKSGYASSVARINTVLRRSLELVLRPSAPGDPEIAADRSWMLRLPPRDLLRDLDADPLDGISAPETETGAPREAAFASAYAESAGRIAGGAGLGDLPIEGQVEHWVSNDSPVSTAAPVAESSGMLTTVRLAMRVGDRLDVEVSGRRQRDDAQLGDGADLSERVASAQRVGLAVGYDLTDLSRLDVEAAYGREALSLGGFGGYEPLSDGRNVTRAARTAWHSEIGRSGQIDVTAFYIDSQAMLDGVDAAGSAPVTDRLWHAGGRYETSFGADHTVSFGMNARMLDVGSLSGQEIAPAATHTPLSLAGPEPAGWAVHLYGGDDWMVAAPVTLNFRLDYHRSLSLREVSHLVPQAGLTLSPSARTRLRVAASWLLETGGSAGAAEAPRAGASPATRDPLGYEASIEHRPDDRSLLLFSVSSRPISSTLDAEAAFLQPLSESRPVYLSDGLAQSREASLELHRSFPVMSARLKATAGSVEGRHAASLPGQPLWEMRDGELRYLVAALSGASPVSGTEVRVEFRSLQEQAPSPAAAGGGSAAGSGGGGSEPRIEGISLVLAQDLRFIRLAETRWRLLLAYQSASDSAGRIDGAGEDSPFLRRSLLTAENRLSGGVSVQF